MPIPTARKGVIPRDVDSQTALTDGQKGRAVVAHPNGTGSGQPPNLPSWGSVRTSVGPITVDDPGAPIEGVALFDYSLGDQISVMTDGQEDVLVTTSNGRANVNVNDYLRMEADASFGLCEHQGPVASGGFAVLRVKQPFTAAQIAAAQAAGADGIYVLAEMIESPDWFENGGGG
ncbi:MAG: hypothetical protein AAGM22_27745 [Acidobacteriota bacterium]